jgi:hypothetical protein
MTGFRNCTWGDLQMYKKCINACIWKQPYFHCSRTFDFCRSVRVMPLILRLVVFCLLCLLKGYDLRAQDDNEIDRQIWSNYAVNVPVSEKFSYGGDVGYRWDISGLEWNQLLIRPTANYRFNKRFRAAGALALFQTFNRNSSNLSEFRIHQDLNVNLVDFNIVRLFSRFRAEQRFFYYQNLPNTFNIRLRWLAGAQTRDLTFLGENHPIYLKILFEGFVTLNNEKATEFFINNTRTHFAFGHRLSRAWRYELHYIRQGSRLISTEGFKISQDVFRLRVFHVLFEKESDLPDLDEPDIE